MKNSFNLFNIVHENFGGRRLEGRKTARRKGPVVIGKVPKQRAVGPYHTNEKARSHTRPLAFSYLKALSPAGDHSDAIPTGTSFQAPTRPPARELHGAGPTSDPALHPLSASTQAPHVAGHPFPRPHSRPPSEQQKKRPQRAAMSCNIPSYRVK